MKFVNRKQFGAPRYVPLSEYQERNASQLEERLMWWKKLDTSCINPIYDDLQKEIGSDFRESLKTCVDEKELVEYVQKSFSDRCLEVFANSIPKLHAVTTKEVYSASACHFIGLRRLMEDTHVFGHIQLNGQEAPFFAICDGHAGDGAAVFLKDHLQEILQYVFDTLNPKDDASMENALMMVGVIAEERLAAERCSQPATELRELMRQVGVAYQGLTSDEDKEAFKRSCSMMYEMAKNVPYALGGSTLVCALVFDATVWVANVGDSRCVVVEESKTYQLTDDASLTKEHFRLGIEKRGGTIGPDGYGILRTNGGQGINLARSIGDKKELGVSARAKVSRYNICQNKLKNWNLPKQTLEIQDHRNSPGCAQGDGNGLEDRDVGEGKTDSSTCFGIPQDRSILILGCDGLFDALSTDDVGALVQKCSHDTPEQLSELLVKAAFASGSEDNISAIVLRL